MNARGGSAGAPKPRFTPLLAIAWFFVAFGAGVLLATVWTVDARGRVVNIACAAAFLAVAAVFGLGHRRASR